MTNKTYRFISQYRIGAALPAFTEDEVKSEPMFFSASVDYATFHGGPITQAFINALPQNSDVWRSRDIIFDSRVHMLMPGWYPCIPGWHHDDVPRERADGQPQYDSPSYRSQHVMALVSGEICPTEFAVGAIELPYVPPGLGPVYKHWHDLIEKKLWTPGSGLFRSTVPSNRLIWFDCDSFHQGTKAIDTGFRWFGRLSWYTTRPIKNEIRRQTQVYLEAPTDGW